MLVLGVWIGDGVVGFICGEFVSFHGPYCTAIEVYFSLPPAKSLNASFSESLLGRRDASLYWG